MADVELSTLGSVIKTAYEAEADTNAFTDAEKTKLTNIEAAADVTDTANVTAAGALMDSEVTNLAAVKAFDPTDYATAAQGGTADTAVQPGDDAADLGSGAATDGYVLTADGAGGAAWEAAAGGGLANVVDDTSPQLGGFLDLNGQEIRAAATSDAVIQLADNAGTYALSIQDSDSAEVAFIDSNGGATFSTHVYSTGTSRGFGYNSANYLKPNLGSVEVYAGGTLGLAVRNDGIEVSGGSSTSIELKTAQTVANLPTPAVGMIARVTDADTPAVGSTVTGGGAAAALVWYNGSNWTVIGI